MERDREIWGTIILMGFAFAAGFGLGHDFGFNKGATGVHNGTYRVEEYTTADGEKHVHVVKVKEAKSGT